MSESRLNIGLYVSNLVDMSVHSVCTGAAAAAKDLNANLIIFPGMHLNGDYNDPLKSPYYYQYNTIYDLGGKENLDYLMIMTGVIGNTLADQEVEKFLKRFSDTPVLTISSEHPGYSSIRFDNEKGLKKAINHLIHKHNCRKIAFVSGSAHNADSAKRLAVYHDTLLENGLPIDHNMIVYGDFSEYSDDVVSELIRNNPQIDAICFANDEMAKGGYRVLKNSKYIVGKNISVIGFDNSATSMNLYPLLTTVNADNYDLGYTAVSMIPDMLSSDEVRHITIPTSLIVRNSCGCKNSSYDKLSYVFSDTKLSRAQLAAFSVEDYMNYIFNEKDSLRYRHHFSDAEFDRILLAFSNFFEIIFDYDAFIKPKHYKKAVQNAVADIISTDILSVMPVDTLFNIIDTVYCRITSSGSYSDELGFIFAQIYREFSTYKRTTDRSEIRSILFNDSTINYIVNDVIVTGETTDQALYPVMKRLHSLGISRSYMFLFDKPARHTENAVFTPPENCFLKFSQEHEDIKYFGNSISIKSDKVIDNTYVLKDTPTTLIISPLFSNEEIYGLLVCDMKPELYRYLNKIALQISTALKYHSTLNNWQMLLANEKENSRNFEQISKHDELTGVFNRRGYFDNAQAIISNPANAEKNAIVVFADMDNLKIINDRFGHEDGDYAIKSMAEILNRSFRTTDIIGRIGGDEFAVFALLGHSENINKITNRIADITEKFNDSCTKPYYIHMSIGIYTFKCSDKIQLSEILEKADELLYNQKRNKKKTILKNEKI
ncbi:MAG: GGDEF domain-containing protein [Ruminococcus sp.]|nr:GGDEF domain-containing protein [Ruminococcus sp.]